ncbi:MAG: DUF736 domain-containing protein [Pseudomonadota bacterium]
MANALGYITETPNGFKGKLSLSNFDTSIRIIKNHVKSADNQPDYRVYAGTGNADIGAGWVKTAKRSGRDFISLSLADPQIGPSRIYCTIAPVKGSEDRHIILWNPRS